MNNGAEGMTFSPVIKTYRHSGHLHWQGRLLNLPGLVTGDHNFVLHPTNDGTILEQSETFFGVLAWILHVRHFSDLFFPDHYYSLEV